MRDEMRSFENLKKGTLPKTLVVFGGLAAGGLIADIDEISTTRSFN